jgi:hypothetical protein
MVLKILTLDRVASLRLVDNLFQNVMCDTLLIEIVFAAGSLDRLVGSLLPQNAQLVRHTSFPGTEILGSISWKLISNLFFER